MQEEFKNESILATLTPISFQQQSIVQNLPQSFQALTQELRSLNPRTYWKIAYLLANRQKSSADLSLVKTKDTANKSLVLKVYGPELDSSLKKVIRRIESARTVRILRPYAQNLIKIQQIIKVPQIGVPLAIISVEEDGGHNFKEYLSSLTQPLSYEECLNYIYQVVRGFSLLHSLKIVHGQVKSTNLVIKNPEKQLTRRQIRIINYALSGSNLLLKSHSSSLDTSISLSPEGVKNEGFYAFKSQAFGLGCIMIQILIAGSKEQADIFTNTIEKYLGQEVLSYSGFSSILEQILGQTRLSSDFKYLVILINLLLFEDPEQRLDIFSALRFLKSLINKTLNDDNLKLVINSQKQESALRHSIKAAPIQEQEQKLSYLSQMTHYEYSIRTNKVDRPAPPPKYPPLKYIPSLNAEDRRIILFNMTTKEARSQHLPVTINDSQIIFLDPPSGELRILGGFAENSIRSFSHQHTSLRLEALRLKQLTPLKSGRVFSAICMYSYEETLIIGGMNEEEDQKTRTLVFQEHKKKWREGPELQEERMQASAIRCEQSIYVIGGQWSNFDLQIMEQFSQQRSTIERWEKGSGRGFELLTIAGIPAHLLMRNKAGLAVIQNEILIFGGNNPTVLSIHSETGNVTKYKDDFQFLQWWSGGISDVRPDGTIYLCITGECSIRKAVFGQVKIIREEKDPRLQVYFFEQGSK